MTQIKRSAQSKSMYCFLNQKANVNDVIFSSSHELLKVVNVYQDDITVLATPLMASHNDIYVGSYRVMAKATLVKNQVINRYDTFLIPDPPYPFDLVHFVEFKDYMGKYKCTDIKKDIWGIDEDIIISSMCTYTKELTEVDILEIKSIISEW